MKELEEAKLKMLRFEKWIEDSKKELERELDDVVRYGRDLKMKAEIVYNHLYLRRLPERIMEIRRDESAIWGVGRRGFYYKGYYMQRFSFWNNGTRGILEFENEMKVVLKKLLKDEFNEAQYDTLIFILKKLNDTLSEGCNFRLVIPLGRHKIEEEYDLTEANLILSVFVDKALSIQLKDRDSEKTIVGYFSRFYPISHLPELKPTFENVFEKIRSAIKKFRRELEEIDALFAKCGLQSVYEQACFLDKMKEMR